MSSVCKSRSETYAGTISLKHLEAVTMGVKVAPAGTLNPQHHMDRPQQVLGDQVVVKIGDAWQQAMFAH